MTKFKMVNDFDPNEQVALEATSPNDAAFEAVATLGWGIVEEVREEDDG